MERLTPQQGLQIVQLYYENGRSVKSVYRALRPIYGVHNRPTERIIRHTWAILRKDLGLKAYKIQLVQELKSADLPKRHNFSRWALGKLAEDPHLETRILFSDEAHFWLNGYVNKQNCRIWGEEQSEAIQELPLHPLKTTVWCGLWAGGIIGPYFFKDETVANVTVNGERYRAMINDFLMPEIVPVISTTFGSNKTALLSYSQ